MINIIPSSAVEMFSLQIESIKEKDPGSMPGSFSLVNKFSVKFQSKFD